MDSSDIAKEQRLNRREYYSDGRYLIEDDGTAADLFEPRRPPFVIGGPVVAPAKDGSLCAAGCGQKWVNKYTLYCPWHQDHHEKRVAVREGRMTAAEYEAWILARPQGA